MRKLFFNSFKDKILRGQVPGMFHTSGVLVNSKFFDTYDNDDISLAQFRTLDDFKTYSKNVSGATSFEDTLFKCSAYGVEYSAYSPDDLSEKPLFVNPANSAEFFRIYESDVSANSGSILSYMQLDETSGNFSDLCNTNSGFYYVTKKSQLNWIADRTNDPNNFNNKIKIVLGDDIGNENDIVDLESMICTSPDRPFQGVLDLNEHRIINMRFHCKNNSNGLIGYLGPRGVVKNGILENVTFECEKKISLDKIVNDCSDVVVGGLVGTNYGTVSSIVCSGEFQFNGFCPEVYLVNNKYEYTQLDSVNVNSAYMGFFPNKFCMNSIYNVIPYVGYFNEGVDSLFNDIARPEIAAVEDDIEDQSDNLTWRNTIACLGIGVFNAPIDKQIFNFKHYLEPKLSVSDGFEQSCIKRTKLIPSERSSNSVLEKYVKSPEFIFEKLDMPLADASKLIIGEDDDDLLSPMICSEYTQIRLEQILRNTINSLGSWTAFGADEDPYEIGIMENGDIVEDTAYEYDHGSYIAQQIRDTIYMTKHRGNEKVTPHQRLNPNARIAYYCSPIVGNNFGTIEHIDCRDTIVEARDTFVGFIGNVCGKENCGTIDDVSTVLDIIPCSAAINSYRTYTNNKEYMPSYDSGYFNFSHVFGYNWDYYQTSAGIPESGMIDYSANSAECIKVSDKFYHFHDIVSSADGGITASGIYHERLFRQDDDPERLNQYALNELLDEANQEQNCNFNFNPENKGEFGTNIPSEIREAKLTFGPVSGQEDIDNKFKIYYGIEEFSEYSEQEETHVPFQGEVKFFNRNRDDLKSNVSVTFVSGANEARIAEILKNISFDVKHFDLNYLGDACKTITSDDVYENVKTEFGEGDDKYTISLNDVLTYTSAFNNPNECGSTLRNAEEFAKNIMYAKVATGGDLLFRRHFDFNEPWAGEPDPVDTFEDGNNIFGTDNINDSDYGINRDFNIHSGVGPNVTSDDWECIEDNDEDRQYMSWYVAPCRPNSDGKIGPEGPKPMDPIQEYDAGDICASACNTSGFCTIKGNGKWDVDAFVDENDCGYVNSSFDDLAIQRSMITIDPMPSEELDRRAKELVQAIVDNSSLLNSIRLSGIYISMNELLGNDWKAKLTRVMIPLANRTQAGNAMRQSDSKQYVYLKEENCTPSYYVVNEDGVCEFRTEIWDSTDDKRVGNLDDMYVYMTLLGKSLDGMYDSYDLIFRIPLRKLYIPISAVERVGIDDLTIVKYTEDLANWSYPSESISEGDKQIRVDQVRIWPLIAAYDPREWNGRDITYSLKSIYNVGAVAGMINMSEKFIEYGNHFSTSRDSEKPKRWNYNKGTFGSISNVDSQITQRAAQFVNSLVQVKIDDRGEIIDANDRTYGICNKFALIAPVFEYHQNEVGTSPDPGLEGHDEEDYKNANTNGLDRIDGEAQLFRIQNVRLAGTTYRYLDDVNSQLFSPAIAWANVSNMLDYVNFFEKRITRYCDETIRSVYIPHQSTNYPEMPDLMTNYCSYSNGADTDLAIRTMAKAFCTSAGYPVYSMTSAADPEQDPERMITTRDLSRYGRYAKEEGIRNQFAKTYHYLPNHVLQLDNLLLFRNGLNPGDDSHIFISQSPLANAQNSDYHDIYAQMYTGSPNFCFTQLGKANLRSEVYIVNISREDQTFNLQMRNLELLNQYVERVGDGPSDQYFTWDYDMSPMENPPMHFTIRYDSSDGRRALWIYQQELKVNHVTYPMHGASGCLNDGSSFHLGEMPSEEALIDILNRRDETRRFSEGVAIDGEDFRGVVLFRNNTGDDSLVCVLDCGYSVDLSSGCYVAHYSETKEFSNGAGQSKKYGILTELKV